jgi:hypothetical protein
MLQAVVPVCTEQLQRAMEGRPLLPVPGRQASMFSDSKHRLTRVEHSLAWSAAGRQGGPL